MAQNLDRIKGKDHAAAKRAAAYGLRRLFFQLRHELGNSRCADGGVANRACVKTNAAVKKSL